MIVSDAPNCGVTYDRNSFIIQATGGLFLSVLMLGRRGEDIERSSERCLPSKLSL
jgi:hypothetical protein